jgi:hypothetical protein
MLAQAGVAADDITTDYLMSRDRSRRCTPLALPDPGAR